MKKLCSTLIVSVLSLLSVYGEGFRSVTIHYDGEDSTASIFYNDSEAYLVLPYVGEYARLDESVFSVGKDGYLKFSYKDNKLVIIDGDVHRFTFSNFSDDGEIDYTKIPSYSPLYADKNLESITASSFLTEKIKGVEVKYSPDNLYKELTYLDHEYSMNRRSMPWVEGKADNGIGESITINYKNAVEGISILNGYVTVSKLKLYKENSRLKKIEIENLDTGKKLTASFDDKVYFKYIPFDASASRIKITIKEVYPGSRYSDTCVTAINEYPKSETNWFDVYFNENRGYWHLESQETVLEDCFSGMNLWKNKYVEDDPENER